MKNLLWEKTVAWIRDTEWAQTKEIPAKIAATKQVKSTSKKTETWEPDAVWKAIEFAMPTEPESMVAAHHFVEKDLLPKFLAGMPVDIVQQHHTEVWNTDVQDLKTMDACRYICTLLSLLAGECVPFALGFWCGIVDKHEILCDI